MGGTADDHPAVAAFLLRFGAGDPFGAHEALEAAWRRPGDPLRGDPIARALIQLAAAYVHRERGRPAGALRLLPRVRRALDAAPDAWWGLDLKLLRQTLDSLAD